MNFITASYGFFIVRAFRWFFRYHSSESVMGERVCPIFLKSINPFFPNAPFLYPQKTSENLMVFWCFQGVDNRCIENKWIKWERTQVRGVFKILPNIYDGILSDNSFVAVVVASADVVISRKIIFETLFVDYDVLP